MIYMPAPGSHQLFLLSERLLPFIEKSEQVAEMQSLLAGPLGYQCVKAWEIAPFFPFLSTSFFIGVQFCIVL